VKHSINKGARVLFTPREWDAFIAGVKAGEFDLPAHCRLRHLLAHRGDPMTTTIDLFKPLSLAEELGMRIHQLESSQKRHVWAAAEARNEAAAHDEAAAADAALLAEYIALADTAGLSMPRPADQG